ncbi:hypothetical protein DFH08DRAFT_856130 [Mycena albidolilacea]|uniref:BHLH domain-containing protein n=1 Tax=Mycena albidolilacea TaxID=1033008 RepID=A0AAD7AAZ4_9AGAR|nr:hypothetical protein DFH08DRAFT_856130 [Mycena albidolilacea]
MASAAPSHDSTLSSAPAPAGPPPMNLSGMDLAQIQANGMQAIPGLDPTQLMNLLRHLPGVFTKQLADGTLKEDAAQTLSNLSQFAQGGTGPGGFRVSDPGPSSHPHGPPVLSHLGPPPQSVTMLGTGGMPNPPVPAPPAGAGAEDGDDGDDGEYVDKPEQGDAPARKATGGGKGRGRGGAAMGSEEWTRQRKDNHKEVERRRRGNINEGINELGRIVPSGSGEKAKGAILSRAVQYIHHLKENEARNIEKWTLEKLLMDQAMGDLQVQLDEIRRMWEEERAQRQRAEQELEALRGGKAPASSGEKRAASPEGGEEGDGKRQRTE